VVAGTTDNPGGCQILETGDNSGGVFDWGGAAGLFTNGVWTTKVWTIDVVMQLQVNVTTQAFWVGLSTSGSGVQTAAGGIWARRDTDLSDTNIVFAVCDSATAGCQSAGDDTNQNSVASTITPTGDNPFRIVISHDLTGPGSTSKISMSAGIDGSMETAKTFCSSGCDETLTNLTSSALLPIIGWVCRDACAGNILLDYNSLSITLTRY